MRLRLKTQLPIKETALVKLILQALSLRYKGRALFWRNNTGATRTETGGFIRFGALGSPDILGVLAPSGRLIAIEVKTPTGKLSEHQEVWLTEAKELGALAGVVRSLEDAYALLDEAAL